jgi:hypothetical protein
MKLKLNNVRIAFPNLFVAKAIGDGAPTFNACLIIDPKSPMVAEIEKVISAVAKEKWADKSTGVLSELYKKDKVCFKRTEKTNASGEVFAGFENMFFLNASNKSRPLVIDQKREPLTQADGKPYGGCYVNVQLDVWPQDNEWGRRVNATLRGVQFVRDGDAFSGGSPASVDDFDAVEGADADDIA